MINSKRDKLLAGIFGGVLTAGLVAGCSGGSTNGSDPGAAATRLAATRTTVTAWNSVKFGGGGYVTGLIYHPTTPNLLYARTDVGGAYRWNPSTSTWIPLTDGVGFGAAESRFHGVESLAVDPTNDQLVYMATGMYTSEGNGRLYISSDRGTTWTHVDLPFPVGGNNAGRAMGERLMVDPNKPSTLFYGSRTAGLWKSMDSGQTWAQVTSLSTATMTQDQVNAVGGSAMGVDLVVYDTGTRGSGVATPTIYTAIAPDYAAVAGLASNLYKSIDGGATWIPVVTPVPGTHIPHMVRAADGMFYVVFTKGAGPGADGPASLYKFDGTVWTLLKSEAPNGGTNFGLGGVSVSGSGATTRIALGVTNSWGNFSGQQIVQLSDDGGQNWRDEPRCDRLGLGRRRRDRSVQPRPHHACPRRRHHRDLERLGDHADLECRRQRRRGDLPLVHRHTAGRRAVHAHQQFGRRRHLGRYGSHEEADPGPHHQLEQRQLRRHGMVRSALHRRCRGRELVRRRGLRLLVRRRR
jgi:hypothetical protein